MKTTLPWSSIRPEPKSQQNFFTISGLKLSSIETKLVPLTKLEFKQRTSFLIRFLHPVLQRNKITNVNNSLQVYCPSTSCNHLFFFDFKKKSFFILNSFLCVIRNHIFLQREGLFRTSIIWVITDDVLVI